jgi:hypothetical protein
MRRRWRCSAGSAGNRPPMNRRAPDRWPTLCARHGGGADLQAGWDGYRRAVTDARLPGARAASVLRGAPGRPHQRQVGRT